MRSWRASGQILCSLRLARGWTQVEAAERAGISERLVRKAEAGESIGMRSLALLADLYSTAQSPLSLEDLVARPFDAELSEADMKALVRRWHGDLWGRGRLEIISELAAANCIFHADDRRLRGRAALVRYIESTRDAVGEFSLLAQRPVVFGSLAVTRWRMRLKDPPPSLASERQAMQGDIRGATWIRVADGLLCEAWTYWHFPLAFWRDLRSARNPD